MRRRQARITRYWDGPHGQRRSPMAKKLEGKVAVVTGGNTPHRGEASRTFLLVHGAWHCALHWSSVAALLAGRGSRVRAIDLPGHGLKAKFRESYFRQD